MQRPLEPVFESRLATALMAELLRPGEGADLDDTYVDIVLDDLELLEDDFYASYEVIRELVRPAQPVPTTKFVRVRDTTQDHVVTVEFPRLALEVETLPFPRHSAPYERIDIDEPGVPPSAAPNPTLLPMYSVPYERLEQADVSLPFVRLAPREVWLAESTEIVVAPKASSRVVVAISVLVGALAVGLTTALLAMIMRSAS